MCEGAFKTAVEIAVASAPPVSEVEIMGAELAGLYVAYVT